MADPNVTVERYENGVLVSTETYPKDPESFNRETIEERALSALTDNLAYVALSSPTNAQAAAQIKALTRQMNGVIRLLLNRLDSAD